MVVALFASSNVDIYVKFHEDSLNGFQVIERTPFCDGQSFKGNSSKSINARVMVFTLCIWFFVLCRSSNAD